MHLQLRFFRALSYFFISLFCIIGYVDSAYAFDAQLLKNPEFLKQNAFFLICGIVLVANTIYLCLSFRQINQQDTKLENLASDDITSLMAYRNFKEEVQKRIKNENAKEYEIISIDIDDFKTINSYYGIEKSLFLIAEMGEALKKAYAENDVLLSREGAEIFVIFKEVGQGKSIEEVVEKYLKPTIFELVGENYNLIISVGSYLIQNNEEEFDTIVNFANIARIKGKQSLSTSYEIFTEEMRTEHLSVLTIIDRMDDAFIDKEFQIVFQPRIDFKSQKINGAEALARWHPPIRHAAVFPDTFVPIMEKNNAIAQLDLYVFEEVCRFIHTYSKIHTLPKIAVNFSASSLSSASLLKDVIALLEKYEVNPSQIEIDLNEQALDIFENTLHISVKILKKIGFSVAMDDFGASFASINRLGSFNVDILKLDRSFLISNYEQPKGAIIVEEIIRLAKRLGMEIVSEGVETKEQALWLKSLNCDSAIGYYFDSPLLAEEFIEKIKKDTNYDI